MNQMLQSAGDAPAISAAPAGVTPAMAEVMRAIAARAYDRRPVAELTLAEARARTRRSWGEYWSVGGPEVAHVEDRKITTARGPLEIRFYDPGNALRHPVIYFHGGGFVVGDLETHDCIARRIAAFSGAPVISVAYRRAPEHRYPEPLDDCVAAVLAVTGDDTSLPLDGTRLALAGDSAGASLALGTALRLRDVGSVRPAAMALFFGCYDPTMRSQSFAKFGDGRYMLSGADVRWYWRQYLGPALAAPPLYAAPLDGDLEGLPSAFVGAGDCDPLFDDSVALHAGLVAAHVPAEFRRWPGMIHGCIGMGRDMPEADAFLRDASRWLAGRLEGQGEA